MDDTQQHSARSQWLLDVIALTAIVALAHLLRLDALTLRGEEPRRAAIGIEMSRTGDWLVPRIQGEVVTFRPPLQNWLIGLSTSLAGSPDAISIRLPGVLALLATVWLLYFVGRSFLGRIGGLTAGLSYATCFIVLQIGKLAETDILFTFFVAASLFAWFWGWQRRWPTLAVWCVAYALAALGALTKGAQAPVYLVATSGLYLAWIGRGRELFSRQHLAGIGIFAVIFALWFVPYLWVMGMKTGMAILLGETAARFRLDDPALFTRQMPSFPFLLLGSLLPWSLLLLGYLRRDVREGSESALGLVRFCLAGAGFAFFTCWGLHGAMPRYLLPMAPCAALLIGQAGAGLWQSFSSARLSRTAACGLLALGLFLASVWAGLWPGIPTQPAVDLGIVTLVSLCAGWLVWLRPAPALAGFACAGVLGLGGSLLYQNHVGAKSVDLLGQLDALREHLPQGSPLSSLGKINQRFAIYLDQPVVRLEWPMQEPQNGDFFCIDTRPDAVPDLPFAWREVGRVWCDRYVTQSEGMVIVGQRVSVNPSGN